MPDILSEADAGTGNRKVDGSRLPLDDLIGRFALRPRVSLNVTVDGGGGRERKEERKILFYLARLSETRRKEERIGEGRKIFTFSICIHFTHMERNNKEREREGKV